MIKNNIYKFITLLFLLGAMGVALSCSDDKDQDYEFPDPPSSNKDKPRFIWIDAAANFKDFANSKENIARDLKLAKDAGFTDVVVDVRPTNGDILYKSTVAGSQQVEWLGAWLDGVYGKVTRTATFDYLQEFIDKGHEIGLKVHAGFNTMTGGQGNSLGNQGLLYRDVSKKDWATTQNTLSGLSNTMDRSSGTKFFNPNNENVQDYIIALLKDLAKYNLDGIILDRGRFDGIDSDFSDSSRKKFEAYIGGVTIQNFPDDILPPGITMVQVIEIVNKGTTPQYFKQWLEFRAKTIYDFMEKARDAVKATNSKVKFGVYVGGWYSSYYENGVNWASKTYNTSAYYSKWATPKYKDYGYASLMDITLIGAYANPGGVYGTSEWTMQGFSKLAKDKIKNDCPMVAAGPDVGNWDANNNYTQAQENQAIVNSVKACMDECDGYFLFDMIHLKMANQWQYVKEGIDKAIK
jgi:uncharacterized lipoprotein YddW (UPF0748 family)